MSFASNSGFIENKIDGHLWEMAEVCSTRDSDSVIWLVAAVGRLSYCVKTYLSRLPIFTATASNSVLKLTYCYYVVVFSL